MNPQQIFDKAIELEKRRVKLQAEIEDLNLQLIAKRQEYSDLECAIKETRDRLASPHPDVEVQTLEPFDVIDGIITNVDLAKIEDWIKNPGCTISTYEMPKKTRSGMKMYIQVTSKTGKIFKFLVSEHRELTDKQYVIKLGKLLK